MKPTFGGIKSPIDYRDISLTQVLGEAGEMPETYFNDVDDIPIVWQKKIGCCGGCASSYYKTRLDQTDVGNVRILSFRFPYAIAKCIDGFAGEGTYTRTLGIVAKDYGNASEHLCPSDTSLDHEKFVYGRDIKNIPPEILKEAKQAKISSYAFVGVEKQALKQAIYKSEGCILLLKLGEEWWKHKGKSTWDGDRILPLKAPKTVVSGHFVYLYGYEEDRFYFINSWSDKWGKKGIGYFDYSEYQKHLIEAITFVDIPDKLLKQTELPKKFTYTFNKNLKYGDKGKEVEKLQQMLKADGVYDYVITGYYGDVTKKAVLDFQKKHINKGLWEKLKIIALGGNNFGPVTREVVNKIYSV